MTTTHTHESILEYFEDTKSAFFGSHAVGKAEVQKYHYYGKVGKMSSNAFRGFKSHFYNLKCEQFRRQFFC